MCVRFVDFRRTHNGWFGGGGGGARETKFEQLVMGRLVT